jgi:hypothetical protein
VFQHVLNIAGFPNGDGIFAPGNLIMCRSQWLHGLMHELSSLARTLGSWVQIPLKAWVSVLCVFILCVGRALVTG